MQFETNAQPNRRTGNLTWIFELRGFLAIYVLLHHAALNIDSSGLHDQFWGFLHTILGTGQFRVDIFFVLSGYCLALSLGKSEKIDNFLEFILRRSARLLPPYFIALAFSLILIYFWIGNPSDTHWDMSLPISLGAIVTHVLLIHNWWREYAVTINHPLWSVAVEFQLYFCFPFLIFANNKLGNWKSWVLMTVITYAAWRLISLLHIANPSPYGSSIYYAALFSMGIGAARLRATPNSKHLPTALELLMVLATAAVMASWAFVEWKKYGHVVDQIISFFVGLLVFLVFVYAPGWQDKASRAKGGCEQILTFVGKRSYSIYLVHAPLLQICWIYIVQRLHLKSSGMQVAFEILTGSVLTFFVTEVYYRFIERPFHQLSRQIRLPGRNFSLNGAH